MQNILYFSKKYFKEFIIVVLIIISISLSCYNIFKDTKIENDVVHDNEILSEKLLEEENKDINFFYVDVKGAVNVPDVYKVEEGAIIKDVIALAGGFLEDAYQDGINLSKKVEDEMVIFVYSNKEILNSDHNKNVNSKELFDTSSYNISDWVIKKESIISDTANIDDDNLETEMVTGLVNINTADQNELTTLTGIGEVKAKAIIDYRNNNGKFEKVEDIMNVSGIGETTFAKIKDYITI